MRMSGFKHTIETKRKIGIANSRKVSKICKLCLCSYFVYPARSSKTSFCSNKCRFSVPIRPSSYVYTKLHRLKISNSKIGKKIQKLSGENNYLWKGNRVSYSGLHHWVKKLLGTPLVCEFCNVKDLRSRQYHWANKSQRYLREASDWIRLCIPCHKAYDFGKSKIKPQVYVT